MKPSDLKHLEREVREAAGWAETYGQLSRIQRQFNLPVNADELEVAAQQQAAKGMALAAQVMEARS
jgi:hypothetical protein